MLGPGNREADYANTRQERAITCSFWHTESADDNAAIGAIDADLTILGHGVFNGRLLVLPSRTAPISSIASRMKREVTPSTPVSTTLAGLKCRIRHLIARPKPMSPSR